MSACRKELLTTNLLAERLHISPRSVQQWAKDGRIPSVRLSVKLLRFEWQAVLDALVKKEGK